jgi:hypothetical protein
METDKNVKRGKYWYYTVRVVYKKGRVEMSSAMQFKGGHKREHHPPAKRRNYFPAKLGVLSLSLCPSASFIREI